MCVYGEVKLGTVFAFSCPDNMSGFTGSFPRATQPACRDLMVMSYYSSLSPLHLSPQISSQPAGRLMAGL